MTPIQSFTKVMSESHHRLQTKDQVEGYPFEKNFGRNRSKLWWRLFLLQRLKYLDILAATKDDVLDLMYFLLQNLLADQVGTKEYKKS
jgi:hypothetical protein